MQRNTTGNALVSTLVVTALVWLALCLAFFPAGAMAESGGQGPVFGLAMGHGGIADKSFNAMQFSGLQLARRKHQADFVYDAPEAKVTSRQVLEKLLATEATVIFCGEYTYVEPVEELAPLHPDVLFILLDSRATTYHANVASITFRQNEASYLAGALAALMSKNGKVAALGAMDIPVINDFLVGYRAGALAVAPETEVALNYLDGATGNASPWLAPLQARRLTLGLFEQGFDVVFGVAGGSNKGIINAAKETGNYAIGVDSDQDHMAPGHVLTSVMKRLDVAILFGVERVLAGEMDNTDYSLGLAEGGVSLSPMTYTRVLAPKEVMATVEDLKEKLILGAIQAPGVIKPLSQ